MLKAEALSKLIERAAHENIDFSELVLTLWVGDRWETARQAARIQKQLEPEHDILILLDAWVLKMGVEQ